MSYDLTPFVTQLNRSGIQPPGQVTAGSADGTYSFPSFGGMGWIELNNIDTSVHIVTFVTPGYVSGLAIPDVSVSISAGQTLMCGPFGSVFGTTIVTMQADWHSNMIMAIRVYQLPVAQ